MELPAAEQRKQIAYRDARFTKQYDGIWQSVGKCVFCDLRDKYVIFEENGVALTIILYAYIDGHLMIVPKRHIRSMKQLTQAEWETIRRLTYIAKQLIKDVHGIKGMQFVQKDGAAAQSTVAQHIHFHCIPFDAPNLLAWNYRKLQHTPLENANQYRHARKKLLKHHQRFNQKYTQPTSLPIVCNLVVCNKDRVLLCRRREAAHLEPDTLTIPGGQVKDLDAPLESELAQEVLKEINLKVDPQDATLIQSRIASVPFQRYSSHLRVRFVEPARFLRNTYRYDGTYEPDTLAPGGDCEAFEWVKLTEVANHPRISKELKNVIMKAAP